MRTDGIARLGRHLHRTDIPLLELFPFRYRNPVIGKWVSARYLATKEEVAEGNAEWEIIGPPEIRNVDAGARYFTPFRVTPHAGAMRMFERRCRSILIWNGHRGGNWKALRNHGDVGNC